ncbi:MAG TPA: helix-turn-helix domain-containing protein [Polyangia bacterium]|nr:helix-turn-helix domain-containing protein [Polyangia bacterium]
MSQKLGRPADPHAKVDLLRAAESVFVEIGLDAAKVEDIAARAGKSKGAFYLHFAHKEEAFKQIVEGLLARLAACIDDGRTIMAQSCGAAGGPALMEYWLGKDVEVFEFIWQNRRVMRLLLEGGKSAAFAYLMDEFAERCRVHMVSFFEWGRRQGIYRDDLDVELTSLLVAGAYDRVARQLVRSDEKPDLQRVCASIQRTLGRGIVSDTVHELIDAQVRKAGGSHARRGARAERSAR